MCVEIDVGQGDNPWHPGVVIECFGDEAFIVNASSKHHELMSIAIVPIDLNKDSSIRNLKLSRHSYFYVRNHGAYRADKIRPHSGFCPERLFVQLRIMMRPHIQAWRLSLAAAATDNTPR